MTAPSSASTRPFADRNLLLAVLALRLDFIGRDALVQALNAWASEKKPLGQILEESGGLSQEVRAMLESLVDKHLELHGGDAEKSLAATRIPDTLCLDVAQIADPKLQASLAALEAEYPRTVANLAGLETTAPDDASQPSSPGASGASGNRFKILRYHAGGNLGDVYVAQDSELQREVALKEIKSEWADHAPSRARFLLEATVTGSLEHPGIVPVYGLGAHPDGRPFYAMRFIRGENLHHAVVRFHKEGKAWDHGQRSLELRKLLNRFVEVCDAMAYAHSRGVLHRDLKPSNIMLGPYGETLVVDWGLAKTVGRQEEARELAEETLRPTLSGDSTPTQGAIGTPAYMSPEQAAGKIDQLSPASDVYSLGATLYHLVTGQTPFTGDVATVMQKVLRGEFPPPREVRSDVPAALEAVCLKAMRLAPEDRYPSAQALAEDIQRWLADEPVSAYAEPLSARLSRIGRRHRGAVRAAAAALVVVSVVSTTAAIWVNQLQTERAERLRNDAIARFVDQANAATANYSRAAALSELEECIQDLRSLTVSAGRRPDVLTRLANVHCDAAGIYLRRGDVERSSAHAADALNLVDEAIRQDPSYADALIGQVRAKLAAGQALFARGEVTPALAQYAELKQPIEQLKSRLPRDERVVELEIRRDLAEISVLQAKGDFRRADAFCQRVLEAASQRFGQRDPPSPRIRRLLAIVVVSRAGAVSYLPTWPQSANELSVPLYRSAIEDFSALVDDRLATGDDIFRLADCELNLAMALADSRPDESKKVFESLVVRARKRLEADPDDANWRRILAGSEFFLADRANDHQKLLVHVAEAWKEFGRLADRYPDDTSTQLVAALEEQLLAQRLILWTGDLPDSVAALRPPGVSTQQWAMQLLEQARKRLTTLTERDDANYAATHNLHTTLGMLVHVAKQLDVAVSAEVEAGARQTMIEYFQRRLGEEPDNVAWRAGLAAALASKVKTWQSALSLEECRADLAQAEASLRRCLEVEPAIPEHEKNLAELATAASRIGQIKQDPAYEQAQQAAAIARLQTLSERIPDAPWVWSELAALYRSQLSDRRMEEHALWESPDATADQRRAAAERRRAAATQWLSVLERVRAGRNSAGGAFFLRPPGESLAVRGYGELGTPTARLLSPARESIQLGVALLDMEKQRYEDRAEEVPPDRLLDLIESCWGLLENLADVEARTPAHSKEAELAASLALATIADLRTTGFVHSYLDRVEPAFASARDHFQTESWFGRAFEEATAAEFRAIEETTRQVQDRWLRAAKLLSASDDSNMALEMTNAADRLRWPEFFRLADAALPEQWAGQLLAVASTPDDAVWVREPFHAAWQALTPEQKSRFVTPLLQAVREVKGGGAGQNGIALTQDNAWIYRSEIFRALDLAAPEVDLWLLGQTYDLRRFSDLKSYGDSLLGQANWSGDRQLLRAYLSDACYFLGDLAAAETHVQEAEKLGASFLVRMSRLFLLIDAGRLEEAKSILDEFAQNQAAQELNYRWLAAWQAARAAATDESAAALWSLVEAELNTAPVAWWTVADAYEHAGQPERAVQALDEALARFPSTADENEPFRVKLRKKRDDLATKADGESRAD